jgi:hypothetical protein
MCRLLVLSRLVIRLKRLLILRRLKVRRLLVGVKGRLLEVVGLQKVMGILLDVLIFSN